MGRSGRFAFCSIRGMSGWSGGDRGDQEGADRAGGGGWTADRIDGARAIQFCSAIIDFMLRQFFLVVLLCAPAMGETKYFKIKVVDEQSGRGVPLVELTTTADVSYVTDSNGIVAFDDQALMGRRVFFHVKSHGYEYPKDGFGYRGLKLEVSEAGSATIKIKRLNVAERLYRITGEGIYRDSVLVGEKYPIREPLINGQV